LLAQNAQGGPYEAYVSEQNLVPDSENGPITHPTIDTIFERFAGDRYVIRASRRQ
jgi:heat shock protein HspQ